MPALKLTTRDERNAALNLLPNDLRMIVKFMDRELAAAADEMRGGGYTHDQYDTFYALLRYTLFLPR